MRREKRGHEKDGMSTFLYVGVSVLVILIIAMTAAFIFLNKKNSGEDIKSEVSTSKISNLVPNVLPSQEETKETGASIGKTVNEVKNTSSNEVKNEIVDLKPTSTSKNLVEDSIANKEEKEKKKVENVTNTEVKETDVQVKETKEEEPTFVKPVEGEVIREFAKDKLIYSNTLQEWITHNGIDLKADETSIVKAAADGKVLSIKNDPRYGLTVTISHNSGYKTIYANLLTAEFVTEGEVVTAGQTIGTVGKTASFESLDDSHLHFEVLKDDEYVDPSIILGL